MRQERKCKEKKSWSSQRQENMKTEYNIRIYELYSKCNDKRIIKQKAKRNVQDVHVKDRASQRCILMNWVCNVDLRQTMYILLDGESNPALKIFAIVLSRDVTASFYRNAGSNMRHDSNY